MKNYGLNMRNIAGTRLWAAMFLSAAIMFFASSAPVNAKYAAMIIDAETGQVLHQVNPHTRNYPASLTKMMTLYLTFEAIDSGRLSLDQRMKVSARAARQPASRLGLKRGQTISVREAIPALAIKSANDVAVVFAETLGGSQRDFALKMTAKARQLDMNRTTFRNPSGLPHRGQLSTARDMAVLAYRLLKDFPHYYYYFSKTSFTYRGKTYKSHNKLLTTYSGADGIKTGYLKSSGYNLVTSAERQGRRLIGVIFGGRTARSRDRLMARLLNKGFRKMGVYGDGVQAAKNQAPKIFSPSRKKPTRARKSGGGQWAIQVGAYNKVKPARAMARKVVSKLPRILEGGSVKVVPLKKRNRRPLYRARIHGISKSRAYQACKSLKRLKIDCMEVHLKSYQMASIR